MPYINVIHLRRYGVCSVQYMVHTRARGCPLCSQWTGALLLGGCVPHPRLDARRIDFRCRAAAIMSSVSDRLPIVARCFRGAFRESPSAVCKYEITFASYGTDVVYLACTLSYVRSSLSSSIPPLLRVTRFIPSLFILLVISNSARSIFK